MGLNNSVSIRSVPECPRLLGKDVILTWNFRDDITFTHIRGGKSGHRENPRWHCTPRMKRDVNNNYVNHAGTGE